MDSLADINNTTKGATTGPPLNLDPDHIFTINVDCTAGRSNDSFFLTLIDFAAKLLGKIVPR